MSYTAILISPGRPNRRLEINSPTIRAVDSADLKDIAADTSWGDLSSVQLVAKENGTVQCTRDRPAARHQNVKASARELRNETKSLHDEIAVLKKQQIATRIQLLDNTLSSKRRKLQKAAVVEQYESVSVCLQAFNDVIYDLNRPGGLTSDEKKALKGHSISYITHLMAFNLDAFQRVQDTPLSEQSEKLINAIKKATSLLTPTQWSFCRDLAKHLKEISPLRHAQQHPKPTASTVRRNIGNLLEAHHMATLDTLLHSNPQRMWRPNDKEDTDRSLLAAAGASSDGTVASLEVDIRNLEIFIRNLEKDLEEVTSTTALTSMTSKDLAETTREEPQQRGRSPSRNPSPGPIDNQYIRHSRSKPSRRSRSPGPTRSSSPPPRAPRHQGGSQR